MLRSLPALRGRKSIYSARRKDLGRSSEGAVDYASSVKPCSVVSDQFVTYAQTVAYLQS